MSQELFKQEFTEYIEQHPEMRRMLSEFLSDCLLNRPGNLYEHASKYFARLYANSQAASKPRPLVLAGPSGVGKSTLVKRLQQDFPNVFGFGVSHTTRAPRAGEVHGVHYYYTTKDAMLKEIEEGKFIEHANVFGNLYGTSVATVANTQSKGQIALLDIDVQGVRSVLKTNLNPRCVFIMPPSMEELERRLRARGTDTDEVIARRLAEANTEMTAAKTENLFETIIVNDDLDKAYAQLRAVIEDEARAVMASLAAAASSS